MRGRGESGFYSRVEQGRRGCQPAKPGWGAGSYDGVFNRDCTGFLWAAFGRPGGWPALLSNQGPNRAARHRIKQKGPSFDEPSKQKPDLMVGFYCLAVREG